MEKVKGNRITNKTEQEYLKDFYDKSQNANSFIEKLITCSKDSDVIKVLTKKGIFNIFTFANDCLEIQEYIKMLELMVVDLCGKDESKNKNQQSTEVDKIDQNDVVTDVRAKWHLELRDPFKRTVFYRVEAMFLYDALFMVNIKKVKHKNKPKNTFSPTRRTEIWDIYCESEQEANDIKTELLQRFGGK